MAELISDLINDDVLTVKTKVREYNITVEFTFDHDVMEYDQVAAWFKDKEVSDSYLRKLQIKRGHWRCQNRGLGGYIM